MNALKPIRRPNIFTKIISNETLLYSSDQEQVLVLNPTASLIWELCDGEHNLQEIEHILRSTFSMEAEHDIMTEIQRALEVFTDKGLLQHPMQ